MGKYVDYVEYVKYTEPWHLSVVNSVGDYARDSCSQSFKLRLNRTRTRHHIFGRKIIISNKIMSRIEPGFDRIR